MNAITKNTLVQLRSPLIVNVLSAKAFAQEHIPNSTNIPLEQDDFVQQVEKAAAGKDRTVVVYCADERCDRSSKAARKLEAAGFTSVHDFAGGMEEWKQAGEPVAIGAGA